MKNVLLIEAALTILLRSHTDAGSAHDWGIAEATPSHLPLGSRLRQDPGSLALTLDQVDVIMPTWKPRGRSSRAQHTANRRIARRHVRTAHVNSSIKRCRLGHATSCLRQAGVRDGVMEGCWTLHNSRGRLTPWQPLV